jgi:hypothetical protein
MLTEKRELQGERLSRISSPKRQVQPVLDGPCAGCLLEANTARQPVIPRGTHGMKLLMSVRKADVQRHGRLIVKIVCNGDRDREVALVLELELVGALAEPRNCISPSRICQGNTAIVMDTNDTHPCARNGLPGLRVRDATSNRWDVEPSTAGAIRDLTGVYHHPIRHLADCCAS